MWARCCLAHRWIDYRCHWISRLGTYQYRIIPTCRFATTVACLSSPLLVPLVTCSLALAGLPPPPCAVLTHPQMMKSRKCSSSSASTSWGRRTSTRRSRTSQTRSCLRYAMLCYGGVYHVVCPRMWCMRYDIVHGVHRCCKEKEESNQI